MDINELRARRSELRQQMIEYNRQGGGHALWVSTYKAVRAELDQVHAQILAVEVKDPALIQVRYTYEVCGWSDKHDYFRNKYKVCESLEEAEAVLWERIADTKWRIPTIIVKQTHRRENSSPMDDFDTAPVSQLMCSQTQELVGRKSMCGAKGHSWSYYFKGLGTRYTY